MNKLRELAYRVDPALWVREVLGADPRAWQESFLRAPRGASILALTARRPETVSYTHLTLPTILRV